MIKFSKVLIIATLGIILITSVPYYKTTIYNFTEPKPFSGHEFYNPYKNIGSQWIKANFHAHTIMHNGLANGENTPDELYTVYDSMKYDLPCISNYNSILPNLLNRHPFLTAYEHGLNGGAIHQLVLNNEQANRFDFPFWQSKHHKQFIINDQKTETNIVVLAHPSFKTGYNRNDLAILHNYDLFEITSPRATSINLWDEALSNGHAVWATGSDDAHKIKSGTCGVCWTMINSDTISTEAIMASLKSGKSYATRGWIGQEMNRIKRVSLDSNQYTLQLEHASDSIILKSDWGKTVAIATNAASISYTIKPENSYVRAEIFDTEIWNTYTRIFINPVVRTKTADFVNHNNQTAINNVKTYIWRFVFFVFQLLLLLIIFKLIKPNNKILSIPKKVRKQ